MVNPRKRKQRAAKRNAGVLYLMANTHRRRNRRSRRNRSHSSRRHNPMFALSRKHSYRRRRHNPTVGGFGLTELAKLGVGSAGGFVGTRFLTQLALGDNNTGILGYAANAVMAIALAWATEKFAHDKTIASGVAAGGLGGLFARIWSENFSGVAPTAAASSGMSGYGDAEFTGLGAYVASGYPLPTVSAFQPGSNYLSPGAAASLIASSATPGAASTPAGTSAPQGVQRFAASRLGY